MRIPEASVEVPVDVSSVNLRQRFRLPTPIDHLRQYLRALIRPDPKDRWETVWELNIPIVVNSRFTILRLQRFRPF